MKTQSGQQIFQCRRGWGSLISPRGWLVHRTDIPQPAGSSRCLRGCPDATHSARGRRGPAEARKKGQRRGRGLGSRVHACTRLAGGT